MVTNTHTHTLPTLNFYKTSLLAFNNLGSHKPSLIPVNVLIPLVPSRYSNTHPQSQIKPTLKK